MKAFPLILSAAAVLACGIVVMLLWGFSPPPSLAGLEAALLSGAALIYGFTAWRPTLPRTCCGCGPSGEQCWSFAGSSPCTCRRN